jgi:hypothetical protein
VGGAWDAAEADDPVEDPDPDEASDLFFRIGLIRAGG